MQQHLISPPLLAAAVLLAGWMASPPLAADAPACQVHVDAGFLQVQSARADAAEALFEEALAAGAACQAAASLGMSEVFSSRGRRKNAQAWARQALAATQDPALRGRILLQLGRSLYRKGQRLNKQTRAAEVAFREAITLSGGKNEAAIRALGRLLEETGQSTALATLVGAYPKAAPRTRTERLGRSDSAGIKACVAAKDDAAWEAITLRFLDKADDPDGYRRPVRKTGKAPEVSDRVKRLGLSGIIEVDVWIMPEGLVKQARIHEGLEPDLDRAVLKAACSARYEPAQAADGTAVDSIFRLAINYGSTE